MVQNRRMVLWLDAQSVGIFGKQNKKDISVVLVVKDILADLNLLGEEFLEDN